jgi:single-stranded DNA-binding protein
MQVKGTGRIGKIDKKTSAKGTAWASLSLATSYKVNEVWETIWYKAVCFGEVSVEKGDLVSFEGHLDANVYTNKEGVKIIEPKLVLKVVEKVQKTKSEEAVAIASADTSTVNW